jgi:hypothetical protein
MNDFIYEVDIDLDINYLTNIALTGNKIKDLATHHRLVADDPYLLNIKNKFPFLSDIFNVYVHPPGYSVPIHIDAQRFCAINIPIQNTKNSNTIFYKKDNNLDIEYESRRIINLVKSPTEECFKFTLTKPTLINTTYPHSVINNSDKTRVIISWSVLKPMTFQDCLVSMSKMV